VGGREAAISPARDILDQLDWLTAELEAQRPFLARIPAVQLTAELLPSMPSLSGMYERMLGRERRNVKCLGGKGGKPVDEVDAGDVNAVLGAIISARKDLLGHLSTLEEGAWKGPPPEGEEATLMAWAYQITLADGETLRAVAERIHESQLRLGGSQEDGT